LKFLLFLINIQISLPFLPERRLVGFPTRTPAGMPAPDPFQDGARMLFGISSQGTGLAHELLFGHDTTAQNHPHLDLSLSVVMVAIRGTPEMAAIILIEASPLGGKGFIAGHDMT
jgi:hypothetical protein